jgi:hypothetical protein
MEYHLVAKPIPIAGESPASVLIRAVEGNGYQNLQSLIWAYWQNASGKGWAKAAHTDPGRYKQIMDAFGITVPDGQLPCLTRSGPTSESPLQLNDQVFHNKIFRDDARYYCPECLRERAYWRKDWLLRPFSVCPEHKVYLLKDCPACGAILQPWRGSVKKCDCGAALEDMDSKSADAELQRWWLAYHGQSKEAGELADEFYLAISDIDGGDTAPQQEYQRLEASYAWLAEETIAPWLIEFINQRACKLHPRLQLLPFMRSQRPKIKAMAKAALSQCAINALHDDWPEDRWMSYRDAQLSLGISVAHFRHFMKNGLLDFTDGRPRKRGQVSCNAVNRLLNVLQDSSNDELPTERRSLTCSLAAMVMEILAGKRVGAGYEMTDGLNTLKYKKLPVAPVATDLETVWLGINQIADVLGTYPEAVRFLCKKGMLKSRDRDLKGRKRLIASRVEVDEFNLLYVLAGTFASQINENPTNLAEKLMALGLQAVSGPKIDGTLVYLFRRDDIEKVDIKALREMGRYATSAGRKAKQAPTKIVKPHELSATEVANQLNIRVQDVHILIRKGVLECSDKQKRHIFVLAQSAHKLEQQINNADYISVKEAAYRLNQNPLSLQGLWADSGLMNILELGLWRKVSILEIEKLEQLLADYVTSTAAGRMLSMHRSHLPNLERRGLVHSIMVGTKRRIRLYAKSDIANLLNAKLV